MDTTDNKLPIKVEEFNEIMQTAPAALQRNQSSVAACKEAGQTLLDTIEASGGIRSDELDDKVSQYLVKTKVTIDNMNKRRKPLTQLLTAVSKSFTTLEAEIDIKSSATIPYRLQQARNEYAARKLEEQRRREEEARRKQIADNERAQYRADVTILLDTAYSAYVERHINALNGIFSRATLATYSDVHRQVTQANVAFVWGDYVKNVTDNIRTIYLTVEERNVIKSEIASQKRKEYSERYRFELEGLKQELIDRLPSLRKELEEQEEIRKSNALEAARIEEERRRRQEEAKAKAELERKRREEEAKAKAEAEKAAAEVQAAFDFSAASMAPTPAKAKVKKKIRVTNPQGFMQIYQMWFMREGMNMSMEELEKAHKKMISYCEKVANKDNEIIKSAFVTYEDDVTAK